MLANVTDKSDRVSRCVVVANWVGLVVVVAEIVGILWALKVMD